MFINLLLRDVIPVIFGETRPHFSTWIKEHTVSDKNLHIFKHFSQFPSCRGITHLTHPSLSFFGSCPMFCMGKTQKILFLCLSFLPNPSETLAKQATSEADKPFEGISKAVCERISHSRLDNMNGYWTDEGFLSVDVCLNGWRFRHVLKQEITKRNDRIELEVSKHCTSIV